MKPKPRFFLYFRGGAIGELWLNETTFKNALCTNRGYYVLLNGGASEHKTKRIVKDKNQLQEQLIYLGSGFIESYKCYTLSTSIREIHPVSHVSRAMRRGIAQQHQQPPLPTIVFLFFESPCQAHCVS